jgi:hypothetical protein
MGLDINKAVFGSKYSLTENDSEHNKCNCIDASESINSAAHSTIRLTSQRHPAFVILKSGSESEGVTLQYYKFQNQAIFAELKMQVVMAGDEWMYAFRNTSGQEIPTISIQLQTKSVRLVPALNPSVLRPDWEERWNNCMKRRANEVFGPQGSGLGDFFWGEGFGPGASVLGWTLDCAYTATVF